MKIKSQVYFLLSGILIIPVLFFVFIGLIRYFDAPERIFAPGYEELLSTESISQQDWNKIRKYIENSPKNLRCAVVDKNSMVIFSVIPELQEGTILSENDLIQLMLNHRGNYVYQIDFPFKNIDTAPFVITQFSMEHKERPSIFVDIFWSGGLVLVFIFAFCAIMVFVILRSITKSVLALEEGTRRIADGEFDLELDLKGSNEITSLSYSINKMRQALRDDQFRKSRFIMGISHDLRTPIALIKGYAEAISDGTIDDTEMLKSSLEIICQKSQQLDDMIEDLLNFTYSDSVGTLPFNGVAEDVLTFQDGTINSSVSSSFTGYTSLMNALNKGTDFSAILNEVNALESSAYNSITTLMNEHKTDLITRSFIFSNADANTLSGSITYGVDLGSTIIKVTDITISEDSIEF